MTPKATLIPLLVATTACATPPVTFIAADGLLIQEVSPEYFFPDFGGIELFEPDAINYSFSYEGTASSPGSTTTLSTTTVSNLAVSDSSIDFEVSVQVDINAEITDPSLADYAGVAVSHRRQFVFTLTQPAFFTASGSWSFGFGSFVTGDSALFALFGPNNFEFTQSDTASASGILPPGQYLLLAGVTIGEHVIDSGSAAQSDSYTANFSLIIPTPSTLALAVPLALLAARRRR